MKICIYADETNSTEYKEDGQNHITIETYKPSNVDEKKILQDALMGVVDFIEANF
jgi:hypothetical protein